MPKINIDALIRTHLVPVVLLAASCWLALADFAVAHHVLGRPSYSLGEDSNTPSSLQAEARVGDYFVTYMIFPAFPKPESPGRINLYVTSVDDGALYQGEVAFTLLDDSWLSWIGRGSAPEQIGVQSLDDGVFRQSFNFHRAGDFILSASFDVNGEPHGIDFPLRVGPPPVVGPIGIAVGLLVIVLLSVTLIQRRRAMTGKIRGSHEHPR
jgi:hypothetical protein